MINLNMSFISSRTSIIFALVLFGLIINSSKGFSTPKEYEVFNDLCDPLYSNAYPEPSANLKEVQFRNWGIQFSIPENYIVRKDKQVGQFTILSKGLDAYLNCAYQVQKLGYPTPGHGISAISISEMELPSNSSHLETFIKERWSSGKIIQSSSANSLTVYIVKDVVTINAIVKAHNSRKAIIFQDFCDCGEIFYKDSQLEEIIKTLKVI